MQLPREDWGGEKQSSNIFFDVCFMNCLLGDEDIILTSIPRGSRRVAVDEGRIRLCEKDAGVRHYWATPFIDLRPQTRLLGTGKASNITKNDIFL